MANKVIRVDTEYIRVNRSMIEWQREKICTHAQIHTVIVSARCGLEQTG